MAQRVDNFGTNEHYRDSVHEVETTLAKLDVNKPEENIIPAEITTMELLRIQAHHQSETLGNALEFMRNLIPLQEGQDDAHLFAEQAGAKVTVLAQKTYLEGLTRRNYLVTRMIQKRETEKNAKATGSYFDSTREPICTIPPQIAQGDVTQISDSGLKLLQTFKGDTDTEADNLKAFLRAIYDVAITNRLNEVCVVAILQRKLAGTGRRLIDSYSQEFENDPQRPNLRDIILKLEDRFMSEWQPEIAAAKLSMYTKTPSQTYQSLEGEISELTTLAARGEDAANRSQWIKQKKVAIFKQAINDEDRQIIYRENQSRNITGLPEMSMSQMVDYLIKIYSEQNAFVTASHLKYNSHKNSDTDSIQTVQEKKIKSQKKKDKKELAIAKKASEDQKLKDELLALYEQRNQPTNSRRGNGRNFGRGNGRNFNKGNDKYNPSYNPNKQERQPFQKQNQRGGNGYSNNKNTTKPRVFVTPEMVNVAPNSCLKCNSPTHRFQETDKCVYGTGNLMTRACYNCKEGGHHHKICVKTQKPTIGAPEAQGQEASDPKFSKWPEQNKTVPEVYSPFGNQKNQWGPSLFNN